MTAATVDITQQDVFKKLRAFILAQIALDAAHVVQGLDNRVAMPKGEFIAMTPLFFNRLSTNVSVYDNPVHIADLGAKHTQQAVDFAVQIDCYGPHSQEWAIVLSTLLRDVVGCDELAPEVSPLFADDPRQIPLVTGEEQYLQRWAVTANLQYNPIVTTAQDFFDTAEVVLKDVDVYYPA